MKKKKWLIPVVVMGLILALFVAFVGVIAVKGWSISTGRYLQAKNETGMLILDNSPITMSKRIGKDQFNNLDTGDKILVIHDGIAESYPGQTGVYALFKLSDGTMGDIPQEVVDSLTELGWIETAK